MSLMAAIDTVVSQQLVREGHKGPADCDLLIGGTKETANNPAAGYGFTAETLLRVLEQVSVRLCIDQQSLDYVWSRTRVADCLQSSVLTLIALISRDTVPVKDRKG
jgi:hypothetical protein